MRSITGIVVAEENKTSFVPMHSIRIIEWGATDAGYRIIIHMTDGGEITVGGDEARVQAIARHLAAWLAVGTGTFDIRANGEEVA